MPEPSKIIAELIFKVNLQNLRIQAQYAKKNKNNQFYGIYFSFFSKNILTFAQCHLEFCLQRAVLGNEGLGAIVKRMHLNGVFEGWLCIQYIV